MKTNSLEELKKIELNIYDNDYDNEINSFLSVRIDTRDYIKYYDLTDEQKKYTLETFYLNLLKDNPKVNFEYIHNLFNENYKLSELDNKMLQLIFPNIPDNLLHLENYTPSKKLKYVCLKTPRNNVIANNIVDFLSLDLSDFNGFFKFFLTFLCEFIDKMPKEYQDEIINNQIADSPNSTVTSFYDEDIKPINIDMLKKCAKSMYKDEIKNIQNMQKLFREFIDYIFNTNKDKKLAKFSIRQRFFVYTNVCKDLHKFMRNYDYDYNSDYVFASSEFTHSVLMSIHNDSNFKPLSSEDFLLDCIEKYDSSGNNIEPGHTIFTTNSIYTYFYLIIYFLTLSHSGYIQKCHHCGRYFYTDKINNVYCDRIYEDGSTCKTLGAKLSQKIREKNDPIYGKYRSIYAKKAMNVKRNPDIASYKEQYEDWKKTAKQFIKDIQDGAKTYNEFDKWLDKNK